MTTSSRDVFDNLDVTTGQRGDDNAVVLLVDGEPGTTGIAHFLMPDEARRLAVRLIEFAARTERPEPDQWPR